MKTRIALLSFLFLALAACSRHYRTGDAGVDGTQLNTLLEESLTAGSMATSPDEIQRFRQIFNDPNTTIYFAESSENFGNAFNVAAIYDWNFLGQAGLAQNLGGEVFTEALQHARVFFLDLPYEDRIQSAPQRLSTIATTLSPCPRGSCRRRQPEAGPKRAGLARLSLPRHPDRARALRSRRRRV